MTRLEHYAGLLEVVAMSRDIEAFSPTLIHLLPAILLKSNLTCSRESQGRPVV